jgi:hypothetical protein
MNNENKNQITIQTIPLKDEVYIGKKPYINAKYNLVVYFGGGYQIEAEFIIKKAGTNEIEEVVFKEDMSEYEVNILAVDSIKPY